MARTEARIRCAVWRDRDFTSLPLAAQGLYWMLLSQPDVSLAGIVPYNPHKWDHLCGDQATRDALEPLEVTDKVMVDPTTGELWIRTFVKHDGVLGGVKTRAGMWSAWHNILSPGIRWRFVEQMRGRTVTVDEAEVGVVDEALAQGWVSQDDLDDARDDFENQTEDGVSDGVSDHDQDGVSDGVSPRARADSASDSASDSDIPPGGNGEPFVQRLANGLRDQGCEFRRDWPTKYEAFHELLTAALERLPESEHHSTAMGVIAAFVEKMTDEPMSRDLRSHTARLVRNHSPTGVLYGYGEALEWGAGASAEYADDPLALSKYVTRVVKEKRGAA